MKVTQAQAREFAAHATRTWQAANRIPATQHFRLPTREETRDTKIWRDDDTPAQPGERRPFGLVLVAQPPPAAPATSAGAAPQTALTPEGIPVRVLPEGESALKKHGPDKPLWKKPE